MIQKLKNFIKFISPKKDEYPSISESDKDRMYDRLIKETNEDQRKLEGSYEKILEREMKF